MFCVFTLIACGQLVTADVAPAASLGSFSIMVPEKQTKYYRCTKCARRHKEKPTHCEGCGHNDFFITYQ